MKVSRRDFLSFLKASCAVAALPRNSWCLGQDTDEAIVNDVHSQLNPTLVKAIVRPSSLRDLRQTISLAKSEQRSISIAGGRHSMGGQQFASKSILVDMRLLNRVLGFDVGRGIVEVEAGIEWPELIDFLRTNSIGSQQWSIVQKQSGADRLTIGGALASNIHGRGLKLRPIISDVESFTLIDHTGQTLNCSRAENPELFHLVIGGYGLFGIVTSVRLRLWPRRKLQRIAEAKETRAVVATFEQRAAEGCIYGDYQFSTDGNRDNFLRKGVIACYRPVSAETPLSEGHKFDSKEWSKLAYYYHTHKHLAFDIFSDRYIQSSGQVFWPEEILASSYTDDYHAEIDRKTHSNVKATEVMTELIVPRDALVDFMEDARIQMRKYRANVIFGNVRVIEEDNESFMRWAQTASAVVTFNLHVPHDENSLADAAMAFRSLIDSAIKVGGRYYLTYHRYATKDHIERSYPGFKEFLGLKLKYDPDELFQSDWYRHHKKMFSA